MSCLQPCTGKCRKQSIGSSQGLWPICSQSLQASIHWKRACDVCPQLSASLRDERHVPLPYDLIQIELFNLTACVLNPAQLHALCQATANDCRKLMHEQQCT